MMNRVIAFIALAASLGCSGAAAAQNLPQWNLRVTCAKETDPACRAFEANAYSHLSGEWRSIAAKVRKSCLEDAESFGHTSYRLLILCLEAERAKRAEAEDSSGSTWVSDGLRLLYRR